MTIESSRQLGLTPRFDYSAFRTVGIFVRGAIGDLLLATPLVNAIKIFNPTVRCVLICDDRNGRIAPYMTVFDGFIVVNRKLNPYFDLISSGKRILSPSFDVTFAAKVGFGTQNAIWPKYFKSGRIVSYINSCKRHWSDRLISDPIEFKESIYKDNHYSLGVLNLGFKISVSQTSECLYPTLTPPDLLKTGPDKPYCIVCIGNKADPRVPKLALIEQVINGLVAKLSHTAIVLLCLPGDVADAQSLSQKFSQVSDLQINATVEMDELLTLIKGAEVVCGSDGGVLHMACALNTPIVGVIKSQQVPTWMPLYRKGSMVVVDNVNDMNPAEVVAEMSKYLIHSLGGMV